MIVPYDTPMSDDTTRNGVSRREYLAAAGGAGAALGLAGCMGGGDGGDGGGSDQINTEPPEEEVTIQLEAVAKSTIEKYEQFWACGQCGKVYFEGSHWEKASQQAKKIIKN